MRILFFLSALIFVSGVFGSAFGVDLTKIDRTIGKEPAYRSEPKYCLLVFGAEAKTRVWLVLESDTLYVDRNGDGDLTDPEEDIPLRASSEFPLAREAFVPDLVAVDKTRRTTTLRFVIQPDGNCYLHLKAGKLRQNAWGMPEALRLAQRSREAPVLHFFAPATILLAETPTFIPGRKVMLEARIGVPGLGRGSFVWYEHGLPEKVAMIGAALFPAKEPGQAPIKETFQLEHGCCAPFSGWIDVPADIGAGEVKITLSYPDEKEVRVAPATFDIPHPKAKVKSKPPDEQSGRTDLLGDPLPAGAVARLGTLRFRHESPIEAIAFSPDGKIVATGHSPIARLWDVATGKTLAGGGSRDVRLWDVTTGEVVRLYQGPKYPITALALSPDGRVLTATAPTGIPGNGTHYWDIHLWGAATGKELRRWSDGITRISSLAFSPDSKTLACGGENRHLRFWDVSSGKELSPFSALIVGESVAFSPDGKLLAAAGSTPEASHCSVSLWELATRKRLPQFGEDARFGYSLAFSPDGKTLGVAGFDGILRLWDVATGRFLRQLGGLPPGVSRGGYRYPLAFSPRGKTVAGPAYYTNVLSLWDTETGQQHSDLAGHDAPVEDIVASPDGKTVASRGQFDTTVRLWNAGSGKHLHTLRGHRAHVAAIAFAPDGKTVISGGTAKDDLHVWDAATGKELPDIKAHIDQNFASLAVSPDGRTLAAGTSLGAILLWELATGRPLLSFQAHPPMIDSEGSVEDYLPVNALRFSPDGRTLVSGSYGLKFWVWSVATGRRLRVLQEPGNRIGGGSLALSPDGRTLTALGRGEKSFVWELASGKKRQEFRTPPIHPGSPGWSAFSPDANSFAICGYPYDTVHVWDLLRGEELGQVKTRLAGGHLGRVTDLTFLGDGRRLVSASDDTTMVLWEGFASKKHEDPRPPGLSRERLAALWPALADDDAGRAYEAMRTLISSPGQAVALLRDELRPVTPVRRERLAQLIARLDDDLFAVRQQATRELAELGSLAEPELKNAQASPPSPEVRVRVEYLLDRLTAPDFTSGELRMWRALEVLEQIGGLEQFGQPAKDVLRRMAEGAPGHFFTEEAKSGLKRLASASPKVQGGQTP